ncbi:MAG TPA: glycosyltransferase family 4 protein [Acetobacteraceae bacterium]|nr:glycosyltransferase family 4 protein [Acetobacteraceae bacterium]
MRILFLAHGHPVIQPGGTEAVAQSLFRELRNHHGAEGLFLAAADPAGRPAHPGTLLQPVGGAVPSDEMLVSLGRFDRFHLSQPDATGLVATLAPLVERLRPEVIHIHHPLQWGVEAIGLLRRLAPRAALVITLHDYFALCPREGQLLTAEGPPCNGPALDACRRCLPERSAEDLALRALHVNGALGEADALVSPSEFLRGRFLAAGWDAAQIALIRNGVAEAPATPHRAPHDGRRDRFGMFGTMGRFKGAHIALQASARLSAEGVAHRLSLHGRAATFSPAFMAEFDAALAAAPLARHHGFYNPEDLPGLMAALDWVVVPSIWWENAPLVILEAFRHRRPVICTGIGGMAEHVSDGVDGLHAPRADAAGLAAVMARAAGTPGLWQQLVNNIGPSRSLADVAVEHVALYRRLLSARARPRRAA